MPNFFESIQYDADSFWVVKEFLNTLDGLAFCERAKYIASGIGQSTECADCIFPNDPKDADDPVYDGVFCQYFDDSIIVSEKEFMQLFKVACERYLEIHADTSDELKVRSIIQKINGVG
jgi:CDI immunity protein